MNLLITSFGAGVRVCTGTVGSRRLSTHFDGAQRHLTDRRFGFILVEGAGNFSGVRGITSMMTSDEGLMLQFRGGSREAFDELFARYRQVVYGFFRRRTEDRARAEDLTQETFLAVLRATERYEPRSAVRSYLFGIAYKLLSAERRKVSHDAEPTTERARPDATEAALWVRQALAKLDPQERDILMLREYEQLSYEEIAALLKIPLNTVRSRLFRSRMALKGYLEPAGKEASNV